MVTTNLDAMTDGNASFLRAARSGNVEKIIEHLKGNIDINTSNANGLNALHLAAKEGYVNVVTELLKRGANVNAATKKGNTALHIASLAGQEEVVRVLIQLGANVNVQSQNGFTPLYMAAQENHDSVVSFLLANGANQSLATEDGFTPLAVALQQGHDKVVAVLLENDTKGRVRLPALHIAAKKDDCKAATLLLQSDHNPDVTSKSGFTPLHIAAHYGNENIAKILLSKGADVNYAAKHQITPLHVASKWGKMNMVKLLLENGAEIESATRDGLTPLHCAARSGHDQVVDLLLEKEAPFLAKTKNGLAPLHMASQGDHVDSARILLYHKAPVDDVTVDYLTALHVAAHCGHVKVAKLLLDRKADANARALNGFTPLHIACKKNRIKVVELLLKHGASIEATTESGLTPLHVASFMGCMNIVIYLIQNGANPDVPTVRGETPLHLAARANQTDIIRILLRNGASVDARAREEQTPLHIAARLGNVDIVSLLLQHGAAVDAVTKDMYTALHIAAKEDQEEVASHLLDHGASLTSTTKKGFTPLHLAAKYGNIKVARLLIQKNAPVDAQGKNGVTPLHVAAHYDHVNVALLLLDKGASPHAMAKNGYTPLHIAAKKNQMDIASTLLEYGAKTNSESKAGFTPLHLSSQEGHAEMSSLLIDNKANVNHKANNGLTPLHLCAQDDKVNVANILVKNGAEVDPQTKAGYTPLHVASHFGQINMVKFLLQNEADVHTTTSHGYTPLHQAAQQGHTLVVNYLLENQASPNVTTTQGQTPLSIAQRLGYISVVETLKVVTETTVTTTTTTVTEEKYKVVAPETMQETFMTDSEDEGGEEAMLGDQSYGYLAADEMKSLGDDSLPIDVTKDEKHHDLMHSVKQFGAPMVEEDKLSPQHGTPVEGGFSEKFSPDNIDLGQLPIHAGGRLKWKTFLVSFMVDARGGAMRGCRHSGVRVIIPPRKASMPMRITCRYLRKEKLIHPPPLMEGEACASRILEMGPVGAGFLGPVIIEVPHFASTRGKEREITILRSDTGETWREHTLEASEEAVQDVLNESFEGEELSALEDLNTNRITRILTTDFPQYFAVVTRIRQEVHGVGPEGGMVSSTVVPQVQAIFPEGALTKKIRVGLQAQPIAPELVAKLLGNRVAVSPIVTVEPRRRKFHKPITLTIPVPQAATKGMINQYSGDAPTLRLLCSITGSTKSGGSSKAQWEDVTGSTPLTFVNDCVSFTTTVSARFWLMDCRQVNEVTRFATELYQEAVYVPFMSKFVIFAKRYDPYEAQLRVFCMTDDKEDKTLESQENFTEVAKSRDVEVLEGKLQYLEFAGNLAPVTKSGEQLKLAFQAFHENRLPFTIRVKDPHIEPMGRIAFMKEPKAGRGEPPQIPICNLNVALPEITVTESSGGVLEMVTLEKRYDFIREAGLSKPELIHRADLRLSDIAQGLDKDWMLLAQQLDLSESDVDQIKSDSSCEQSEQALMMLRLWLQKSGAKATGNELEKGLRKINREDIIKNCMFNVELVTDDVEKAVAKVHLDQSGFDVFKEELGSSREASMRRGASLDISYDEQDIMKEAESAAETSSETGSLFERDQISQALTDDKEVSHRIVELSNSPPDDIEGLFPKCKLTSSSQKKTTESSDLGKENVSYVNGTSPFDVSCNSNNVSSEQDPSAMVHETSSIKIHDFWPAQPCTVSTKVADVLPSDSEGHVSVTPESSNVPLIADQTTISSNQEIILNEVSSPQSVEGSKIHVDTTDLGYFSLDKDPNVTSESQCSSSKLNSEVLQSQTVTDSLPQNGGGSQLVLEPESKPELNSENISSVTSCTTINQVTVTSTSPKKDHSDSSLVVESTQVNQSPLVENGNVLNNICSPGSQLTNDDRQVFVSVSNSGICTSEDPNSQDARIRRASKTPPPTLVDELDKDGVDVKIKETLFSPSSIQEKLKEDGLKESLEVDIKSQELAGRQEIPARLTESETWPSLELDTSQVSISSLPDDEKSEPTTATASDAIVITTEPDKVTTHVENVEKTEVDEHGVTTRIIQTVTTRSTVHSGPETVHVEEVPEIQALPGSEQPAIVQKLDSEKQPSAEKISITQDIKDTVAPIVAQVIGMATDVSESIKDLTRGDLSKSEVPELPDTEGKVTVVTKTVQIVSGPEIDTKEQTVTSRKEYVTTEGDRPETESSEAKFVPCAFDNSAFAGAGLIDQVEQSGPVRARSPYEVVREDIPGEVHTTYVTKHVEVIRRSRPLLQNIPSEISEEDLVEREIVSPLSKKDPESFDLDVEADETKTGADFTTHIEPGDTTTTTVRTDQDGTETKTSEHVSTEKVLTDSGYTVTRTVVTRVRQTVGHSVDDSVPSAEDVSSDSHREDLSGRTQMRGTEESRVASSRQMGEGAISKTTVTTTSMEVDRPSMNGPGEVEYHPEYDGADDYGSGAKWSEMGYERGSLETSDDVKKSRYSSVSDDVIDSEIREIISSDQQFEDIIERPMTPEPPVEEYEVGARKELDLDPYFDDGDHAISSPVLSPDDPKAGFAYGMQFEKEEAMDMDSDPYSEEKEPVFGYGMRFERDPDLEEELPPCYGGDLYTHVEEDEDALENGDKNGKPNKAAAGRGDFDILAGRKFFTKNVDVDELSMSSLQEFERLEAEIVSGRKSSVGSVDSLNGKIPVSKSGDNDDVSMSSLTEFERLEKELIEGEGKAIDPAMQESITQLSEIEEGHESQASEPSNEHKSSEGGKDEDLSVIEEYDHHLEDVIMKSSEHSSEPPFLIKDDPSHRTAERIVTKVTTTVVKTSSGYKFDEDIDQDSLHDELSLKPDSLVEESKEYVDSLHEGKCDDADSLQGDLPDDMRDSLFEDRHLEDDSLHEMDVLPDESSLSMESSFAAGISRDSSKADDHLGKRKVDIVKFADLGTAAVSRGVKTTEIIVTDLPRDVMLSSTDSLEQSSSGAAAFHLESESMVSSSLAQEDCTMVSSTDTLEHEGRITFRYEDIPVDELEILVKDGRKVIVDSEGNIQTEYDVKHFLETEENINYDFSTKESTAEAGEGEPEVEVEEIHTTDEFGNPKTIRKIRKTITSTKTQYSSSSSSDNVEEKMKEFLMREHAGGSGKGEEVVEEERSLDEKGNVVLVRTVRQQVVSQPEVHSRTFSGPEAELLSRQFVERFEGVDPTDEMREFEKVDDEGNVVRVTQQVVIKPEVHSVSFSGPNARQEMEEYMRKFAAPSQNGDGKGSWEASGVRVTTQQRQEYIPAESSSHETVSGTQFVKTTVSSLIPEASERVVQSTITTSYSVDESGKPIESTDQTSSSIQ